MAITYFPSKCGILESFNMAACMSISRHTALKFTCLQIHLAGIRRWCSNLLDLWTQYIGSLGCLSPLCQGAFNKRRGWNFLIALRFSQPTPPATFVQTRTPAQSFRGSSHACASVIGRCDLVPKPITYYASHWCTTKANLGARWGTKADTPS